MTEYNELSENSSSLHTEHTVSPRIVLLLGIIIFAFLLFGFMTVKRNLQKNRVSSQQVSVTILVSQSPSYPQTMNNNKDLLAKAGAENIYQQELGSELKNYPFAKSPAVTKQLLQKIIKDSIILQAAQAEGLITLDPSVFDSPDVVYAKRIQLVDQAEKMIEMQENTIKGSFVSLWFDNVSPGTAGYLQGKQIAYQAIQQLYDQVKNNTITMDLAAKAIENNASLVQVDPQYRSNAISVFTAGPTDKITFDPAFDAMIRDLAPGQITQLYLAKDKDLSGKTVDAVYMFAQVTNKTNNGRTESFDQWYSKTKQQYAVTIY